MSTKLPQDRQTCYSMIMKQPQPASTQINTMDQREQLIEDIDSIVDEYFQSLINECDDISELSNIHEAQDDLTRTLCDAVYKNFPTN